MANLSKSFGGVRALAGIDFDVRAGEVHALLGQNGAGKSTLIKILSGAQRPDSGTIKYRGEPVTFATPRSALEAGIATVYQDPLVYPELSVAENVFMGRELRDRFGNVDHARERSKVGELLAALGADTAFAQRRIGTLRLAERQLAMIAKALSVDPTVIIFDEPTAILTAAETETLFANVRRLRAGGAAIVYISHRIDELFAIADRVTVLKDGATRGTYRIGDVTAAALIEAMVGSALAAGSEREPAERAEPVLEVCELRRTGAFQGVSFSLAPGEIVGFFGLVGAGRSEVARAIFGEEPADGGTIVIDGTRIRMTSPRRAKRLGIAYLPEDRKGQGLFGALSIVFNVAVVVLSRLSSGGAVASPRRERALARTYVDALAIKSSDPLLPVSTLSGGNQQKVVLAKWLASKPRIFILDEPTAGVDVAAKAEIHRIVVDLARRDRIAVIVISSELPEILALADRLLVMRTGWLVREFPRGASASDVLDAALRSDAVESNAPAR